MAETDTPEVALASRRKRWGIYYVRDHCWHGDNSGPVTFEDHLLAVLAANVLANQVGAGLDEICVVAYDGSGIQKKDEIPLLRDTKTALERLESGRDIAVVRPLKLEKS